LVGALLLCIAPLWAQLGTVHVRVTRPDGSAIPHATVTLRDRWGKVLGTRSSNDVGEVLWTHLLRGDLYFVAEATDFYSDAAGVVICDGALEHRVAMRLEPMPEWERGRMLVTVEAAASMIDRLQIPICQVIDLPAPQSKPAARR